MEPEHEDLIRFPTAKLTVVVGLDDFGDEVVSELWENLGDPDRRVDMFTKLGIVGMVQQTLTGQSLGIIGDDEES